MTLRITRRTALASAGAAAIGSLAIGRAITPAHAQAKELSFWTWRQEDKTQYATLWGEFTAKNTGITVGFQGYEPQNYGTALSTALAAGKGPDIIHIRAYGGTEQFAKAGYLLPLTPATVPELANFTPAALGSTSMRSDKTAYAVPFASQTLGLFINREIFTRLGLTVPQTWDQLIATAKTIKEKGGGVLPFANGMATAFMCEIFASVFMVPQHGAAFTADMLAGKATFEDPRYVAALNKLTELKDYLPPGFGGIDYPTMQQLFISGRAAMFAGGSFEIANFKRQNPNLVMEFHAPPAPAAGQPRLVSLFYDGGYAINAKTDNKDAALKLIRHLATPEFGTRFSGLLGNISPIAGATIADPMLAGIAELNKVSSDYIMAVHFRYETPTGSTLLQSGIQKLMGGTITAAALGTEITQGIATYHAPFKK